MKIKINPNCENGEHVFIPANTCVQGRETFHTAWTCQHCLYHVSASDWDAHIRINFEKSIPGTYAECNADIKEEVVLRGSDVAKLLSKPEEPKREESKLPYPGNKRGPKPKGTVKGLS